MEFDHKKMINKLYINNNHYKIKQLIIYNRKIAKYPNKELSQFKLIKIIQNMILINKYLIKGIEKMISKEKNSVNIRKSWIDKLIIKKEHKSMKNLSPTLNRAPDPSNNLKIYNQMKNINKMIFSLNLVNPELD